MTVETFITNFGHLADAPNGVQKLRELILGLAVRGKLTEQQDSDAPVSQLLNKLDASKQKLVEQKVVRDKDVVFSTPILDVFDIPEGWKWVRIGQICYLQTGATPSRQKPEYFGGNIKWLVSGDIHKGDIFDCDGRITEKGMASSNCKLLPEDSVMIALNGQGKTRATVAILRVPAACNQSLVSITPFDKEQLLPEYVFWSLRYRYYEIRDVTGQKQRRGLNMQLVGELSISLPPLAEQKRIVAKVDLLMALCNELEARQQKQQQKRVRLNNAALDALLTAREPDEFADHRQRISTNFDLLYDHPDTIAKLRAAILQLAVQGKLLPQNPEDEPAEVLLERIKAENERLVEDGMFRKTNPVSPVASEDAPYQAPNGWMWVKLDALADIGTGTTPSKTNPLYYADGSVPWVTSSATSSDLIRNADTYVSELAVKECRLRKYPPGTLVIALYGQGKTRGQVAELVIEATVNQACSTINVGRNFPDLKSYIRILLEKQYDELRALASGGAQPNLNVGKIKDIVVPLPPQKEQKRIVAKIDQLMALCGELEAKLNQARQRSEKLMEATVRQLLVA